MKPAQALSLTLVLALLAACQMPPTSGSSRRPAASGGTARPGGTPSAAPGGLGAFSGGASRVVDGGALRQVQGMVRVLTPWALALKPEERGPSAAGRLLSNNSGNLISNHGAGIISDQGGGLIGKTKFYQVAQAAAAPLPEDRLADAVVEVLDAQGQRLVGSDGKDLVAISGPDGRFRFEAKLPSDETLVFRVRLAKGGELAGGQLMALVPPSKTPDQVLELGLGTASSMGAAYVLDRFVKGEQRVLNKLPAQEAEALILDAEAARNRLPEVLPSYEPQALASSLEGLLPKAPELKATVDRIASLLLAGQEDLGSAAQADQVPLLSPVALAYNPQGSLLIAELVAGRVRAFGANGRLSPVVGRKQDHFAGEGLDALGAVLEGIDAMVQGPDGELFLAEKALHRVWRVDRAGKLALHLGAGVEGGSLPGLGKTVLIHKPSSMALAQDGALWVGEGRRPDGSQQPFRLIRVDSSGQATQAEGPPAEALNKGELGAVGLAWAQDGALWLSSSGLAGRSGQVWRRLAPGPWQEVAKGLDLGDHGHLLADGADGVLVSEYRDGRVLRLRPDGASVVFASGLRYPAGLAREPQGGVLLASLGQHAVLRFPPEGGDAQRVIGVEASQQVGAAQAIPVAAPGGLSYDAQGALYFSEVAGGTLKRLLNGQIQQVAGGNDARFKEPSGVAVAPDGTLYAMESFGGRLWRQRPGGPLEPVVGTGALAVTVGSAQQVITAARFPALSTPMGRPVGLRVGPDGLPYWVDQAYGVVLRLAADGQVEVVAGKLPARYDQGGDEGDGAAPNQARFDRPNDMAFDAEGRIYVADTLNFRVRCVDLVAQPPVVRSVAGQNKALSLAQLFAGQTDALLLGPVSLALGGPGELYVGTLGTSRLRGLVAGVGLALPPELALVGAQILRVKLQDGSLSPLAGPGGRVMNGEREALLGLASGLAFAPSAGLAVSDGLFNQIRLIPPRALSEGN